MKHTKHSKQDDQYTGLVYVAPNGNDATGEPENPEKPYKRFDYALTVAGGLEPGASVIAVTAAYDVDYALVFPDNVSLKGSGAVINSTVDLNQLGPTVVLGNNSILSGLTIRCTLPQRFQAAMGSYGQKGCLGARVIQCRLIGSTDGVYLSSADRMKEILFEECIIESPWDGVAIFDSNTRLRFSRTTFNVQGPPGFTTDAASHGIIIRGEVGFENCIMTVTGPNPGNRGVWNTKYGAGAIIKMCGTCVLVSGTDSKDIEVDPSSIFIRKETCQ